MKEPEWQWFWAHGVEPGRYELAGANTREAAIEEGRDANEGEPFEIAEGKRWQLKDHFFDAERLLEDWHDFNSDAADEDGDLEMNPTPAQARELENCLAETFRAWRARHGLGRAWAIETRNVEVIDAGHQQGSSPENAQKP